MLYKKYKLLQIGIPRTGSTGIFNCLRNLTVSDWPNLSQNNGGIDECNSAHGHFKYFKHGHIHYKEYESFIENNPEYKTYFTFSFIRNPYDRAVSLYTKHHSGAFTKDSFLSFWKKNGIGSSVLHTWGTQTDYLINIKNKITLDFIGRLENFGDDWGKLRELKNDIPEYDLKYKNTQKSNRESYDLYYTDESQELIYTTFKDDFENFNYKKELKMETKFIEK